MVLGIARQPVSTTGLDSTQTLPLVHWASAISSAIELEKSAKAGKQARTLAKIGRRQIVAVARDELETAVNIGFPEIARRDSHSLRQTSTVDFLSIFAKATENTILFANVRHLVEFIQHLRTFQLQIRASSMLECHSTADGNSAAR